MTPTCPSSCRPWLLTFLGGAALGAVVVALTTPKTGPRLRKDLKDLVCRARTKAGCQRPAEDVDQDVADLLDGYGTSATDPRS
jgi:gas vesicle protein